MAQLRLFRSVNRGRKERSSCRRGDRAIGRVEGRMRSWRTGGRPELAALLSGCDSATSLKTAVPRVPCSNRLHPALMELLDSWAAWLPGKPPYILDADREYFESARSSSAILTWDGWEAAHADDSFGAPGDNRLHLGLLPFPFSGDVRQATVYLLLLNPGVGPTDYYGEYEVQGFREARLGNLRQQFSADYWPFVGLDPRFAWHGGFEYWHGKLRRVIAELAGGWQVSFAAARQRLAHTLAIVELFPYHSEAFADASHWLRDLPSVDMARRFVREVLLPKVRAGDAIAIVTRQARAWDLPSIPGVVTYTAQQARAAHLTPDSPGGTAIIKHLLPRRSVLTQAP